MKRSLVGALVLGQLLAAVPVFGKEKKPKESVPTPLDVYVKQAHATAQAEQASSPGSLYIGPAPFVDLASDVKARYVDDVVTILVDETADATSTGATKTSRATNSSAGLSSAAGKLAVPARLGNIITTTSNSALDGKGTTSRTTTLTTTLSARVVDVLPNGFLVVEGSRTVQVNSENQVVTLRGVVRPNDLSNFNTVRSSAVAQMELTINGKGVVNDFIHRPNILYRILLGALPF